MLQLNPSTDFPIVRVLTNPADVTGYYVRAIIKNSLLQTVIATVNLTDLGDGYFKGTWHTPSSEGIYVDITTKVYSDAGYSVASEVYGSENNQYLCATRWGLQFGGGGGGESVSYKKIDEIVKTRIEGQKTLTKEEVKQIVESTEKDIKTSIKSVLSAVDGIEMPKMECKHKEMDITKEMSPILSAVNEIRSAIEVLKEEEIDTTEVEEIVSRLNSTIIASKEEIVATMLQEDMNEQESEKETLRMQNEALKQQLAQVGEITKGVTQQKTEQQPSPFQLRAKNLSK
jgi:hypothetical protein